MPRLLIPCGMCCSLSSAPEITPACSQQKCIGSAVTTQGPGMLLTIKCGQVSQQPLRNDGVQFLCAICVLKGVVHAALEVALAI